jgi:hypothetical protein
MNDAKATTDRTPNVGKGRIIMFPLSPRPISANILARFFGATTWRYSDAFSLCTIE